MTARRCDVAAQRILHRHGEAAQKASGVHSAACDKRHGHRRVSSELQCTYHKRDAPVGDCMPTEYVNATVCAAQVQSHSISN